MYKVRCYENENLDNIIGMVDYTDNLYQWDGHNICSGIGRHLGVDKTDDGRYYYVCYGIQWDRERDYAHIISKKKAKKLVLEHNPDIYEGIFGEAAPEL